MTTVRTMSRAELGIVLDWAAGEGWNLGRCDAIPFHVADPTGFLIAEADDGELAGEPAAAISVVRYGDRFGFLGLYIVKPEYRGRGLGMTVWKAGMAYFAGRTVGLDGVPTQQHNYRKSGFELAYRNVRFQGPAPGVEQHGARLLSLCDIPFDRLLAYDLPLFGAPRAAFLSAWISMPGVIGLAADDLKGYVVARPCIEGWKIGPLFADDEKTAEALFLGICARLPSDGLVILDVPEPNATAMRLAERVGFTQVFETARMYAGPAPDLDVNRIYGVTSFELG
jgi:GNAT superfamily N-acetyltransferase